MMSHETVEELFGNEQKFLRVLAAAELNASTDWECEFTDSLRDRYEQYGANTQLSHLQHQQLVRIADK